MNEVAVLGTEPPIIGKSLKIFKADNPFRVVCHRIVFHPYFSAFMIFAVFVHILSASAKDFLANTPSTAALKDVLETVVLIAGFVYTLEALIIIIAIGLTGEEGYLGNVWHRLELAAVVSFILDLILSHAGILWISLTPFRGVSVLSQIRLIGNLKYISSVFLTLTEAGPLILGVAQISFFIFLGFSTFGLGAFGASLRRRCLDPLTGNEMIPQRYCKINSDGSTNCPLAMDGITQMECSIVPNPHGDALSFDNIGSALLALFQTSSLDQWQSEIMHPLRQGEPKFSDLVWLYFLLLIASISFITFYLFSAIISLSFEQVRRRAENEDKKNAMSDNERDNLIDFAADYKRIEDVAASPTALVKSAHLAREKTKQLLDSIVRIAPQLSVVDHEVSNEEQQQEKSSKKQKKQKQLSKLVPIKQKNARMPHQRGVSGSALVAKKARERSGKAKATRDIMTKQLELSGIDSFRFALLQFVHGREMVVVHFCLVVGSIAAFASEYNGMSDHHVMALSYAELGFHCAFSCMVLLEFAALGPRTFIVSYRNIMDAIIIVLEWIGYLVPAARFLVLVGLGRMVHIVMRVGRLRNLAMTMFRSIRGVVNIVFFALFCVVAYAIVGIALFKDKFIAAGTQNFSDLSHAMLSLFQVMSRNSWTTLLFTSMTISYPENSTNAALERLFGSLYFCSFFAISNLILLNMFLSVVLHQFELHKKDLFRALQQRAELLFDPEKRKDPTKASPEPPAAPAPVATLEEEEGVAPALEQEAEETVKEEDRGNEEEKASKADVASVDALLLARLRRMEEEKRMKKIGFKKFFRLFAAGAKKLSHTIAEPLNRNIWIPWTRTASKIGQHLWFPRFTYVSLILFLIQIAVEPTASTNRKKIILGLLPVADIILFLLLLVENAVMLGCKGKEWAKSVWGVVDIIILVSILVQIAINFVPMQALLFVRVIKSVRPLKLIGRHKVLNSITTTLMNCMPAIGFVIIFFCIILIIVTLVGTHLFRGRLYWCNKAWATGSADCLGRYIDSEGRLLQAAWQNPKPNFDQAAEALLTTFRICCLQWIATFARLSNITDVDLQPIMENNFSVAAAFCTFSIFFTRFVFYNLFVSVLSRFFKISAGVKVLTEKQKCWMETKSMLESLRYDQHLRPIHRIRQMAYDIVTHPKFGKAIVVTVLLNTVILCTKTVDIGSIHGTIVNAFTNIFLVFYIAEMILKITAYGLSLYVASGWNVYDAIVIIGSVFTAFIGGALESMARMLRVLRLIRMLNFSSSLTLLFKVMWQTLPTIVFIFFIYILVMTPFSAIGVYLFGDIKNGEVLGPSGNFSAFYWGMLMLFQIVTGDQWDVFMDDCRLKAPFCTNIVGGDCGSGAAVAFFPLFVVIANFVLLNLVMATVIETYDFVQEGTKLIITDEDVMVFSEVWGHYDMDQSGKVPLFSLRSILMELDGKFAPQFSLSNRKLYLSVRYELEKLMLTRHQNFSQFRRIYDLLLAMATKIATADTSSSTSAALKTSHRRKQIIHKSILHERRITAANEKALFEGQGRESALFIRQKRKSMEVYSENQLRNAANRTAISLVGNRATGSRPMKKGHDRKMHLMLMGATLKMSNGLAKEAIFVRQMMADRGWGENSLEFILGQKKRSVPPTSTADVFNSKKEFTFNELLLAIVASQLEVDHFLIGERNARAEIHQQKETHIASCLISSGIRAWNQWKKQGQFKVAQQNAYREMKNQQWRKLKADETSEDVTNDNGMSLEMKQSDGVDLSEENAAVLKAIAAQAGNNELLLEVDNELENYRRTFMVMAGRQYRLQTRAERRILPNQVVDEEDEESEDEEQMADRTNVTIEKKIGKKPRKEKKNKEEENATTTTTTADSPVSPPKKPERYKTPWVAAVANIRFHSANLDPKKKKAALLLLNEEEKEIEANKEENPDFEFSPNSRTKLKYYSPKDRLAVIASKHDEAMGEFFENMSKNMNKKKKQHGDDDFASRVLEGTGAYDQGNYMKFMVVPTEEFIVNENGRPLSVLERPAFTIREAVGYNAPRYHPPSTIRPPREKKAGGSDNGFQMGIMTEDEDVLAEVDSMVRGI